MTQEFFDKVKRRGVVYTPDYIYRCREENGMILIEQLSIEYYGEEDSHEWRVVHREKK